MSKTYTFPATITITANSLEEAQAYLSKLDDDLSCLDGTESEETGISWKYEPTDVQENDASALDDEVEETVIG